MTTNGNLKILKVVLQRWVRLDQGNSNFFASKRKLGNQELGLIEFIDWLTSNLLKKKLVRKFSIILLIKPTLATKEPPRSNT